MFQIGDSLREARTRRGFSPADVHKAIRIRERYLTALEEERWDMLPGEAYAKGFLRTYAEYLGLNGQLYIDEYNARIARNEEDAPLLVPHPTAERHMQRGVLVGLAAIVVVAAAVAGLAAWRLTGTTHGTAQNQTPPAHGSVAAAARSRAHSKRKTTPNQVIPAGPVFASFSATRGRCWLLVRADGANGTVLYEGILEQGQAKRFQVQGRLWVRMGRPDVLDITLAGKKLPNSSSATPSNLVLTRGGALSQ